jgi:FHS family Na+ dependent glucose MFS transporter 1
MTSSNPLDIRMVRGLAVGASLAYVVLGLSEAALGPALLDLAKATGSTLSLISYLFIAQYLGYMLGAFFGGRLYDRLPGNRLMACGLLAFAPALLLIPVIRSLAVLLAVVGFLGIQQGIVDVGGNLLILWTPPEGRGVRMNALHLLFGVGAFLSPLLLAQAIRLTAGVAWQFRSLALLALPPVLFLLLLPPIRGRHDAPAASSGRARPLLVALAAVLLFLVVAAEIGFASWIYAYALKRRIAGAVSAAYLTSLFWGSFAIGRLASTLLSLRLPPLSLILASMGGCLASMALLLALPQQPWASWLGAAAYGFFVGPLFASILNLTGEAVRISGQVAGIFLVGTSLGMLFLPWLIGQLFEPLGPSVLPVTVLIVLAAALLCCALLRLAAVRGTRTAATVESR